MLILNMILRITGFTQEELANYVGVSRASINAWLDDDSSMSENSKRLICEKFQIPYNYFQIDLNQNLDYYKLVFSTIYENWKRINSNKSNTINDKINDILNQIDSDITPIEYDELNEMEILEGISNGCNPFTGEVFDDNHILNNTNVKSVLQKIYKYYSNGNFILTKDDLDEKQLALFEELRKWRRDKYLDEGYYHAYIVFNDRELINIITSDINTKEDLKKVSGIGKVKYEKYGDELFKILSTGKYEEETADNEESDEDDDIRF